jgi:hypothetical protein
MFKQALSYLNVKIFVCPDLFGFQSWTGSFTPTELTNIELGTYYVSWKSKLTTMIKGIFGVIPSLMTKLMFLFSQV